MTGTAKRRRKGFTFGAAKDNLQWSPVLKPFDQLAQRLEAKWGCDRLPKLQDEITRTRWSEVMDELNSAIDSTDMDALKAAVTTATRGLEVMDQKAEAAGHKPPSGFAMLIDLGGDGGKIGIAEDAVQATAAKEINPEYEILTIREAALAYQKLAQAIPIGEIKEMFPNSHIANIGKSNLPKDFWEKGGDEIPFGEQK